MQDLKPAMESGFAEFINAHRLTPSTRLTLLEFDAPGGYHRGKPVEQLTVRYVAKPILDVPTALNLEPRGGTPLIDSLCTAIDQTGERLKFMRAAERPAAVLFVIITDGQENASTKYKRQDAFNRITHQQDTYAWQFVFMGTNQDAIAEAMSYGIPAANSLSYGANQIDSANTLRAAAMKTSNFTAAVASGTSAPLSGSTFLTWTEQERKQATEEEDKS